MAKGNLKEFADFQAQLHELSETQSKEICKSCANQLGQRLKTLAVKKTPVVTGKLRRDWTVSPEVDKGSYVEVQVINTADYAPYVEYGHRKRKDLSDSKDGKIDVETERKNGNWVEGKEMLTKSEKELSKKMPDIVKKIMAKKLGEIFD